MGNIGDDDVGLLNHPLISPRDCEAFGYDFEAFGVDGVCQVVIPVFLCWEIGQNYAVSYGDGLRLIFKLTAVHCIKVAVVAYIK